MTNKRVTSHTTDASSADTFTHAMQNKTIVTANKRFTSQTHECITREHNHTCHAKPDKCAGAVGLPSCGCHQPALASRLPSDFCRSWHKPSITFCSRTMLASRAGTNLSLMMVSASAAATLQAHKHKLVSQGGGVVCVATAVDEVLYCYGRQRSSQGPKVGCNCQCRAATAATTKLVCLPACSSCCIQSVNDLLHGGHPGVSQPCNDTGSCKAVTLHADAGQGGVDGGVQVVCLSLAHCCAALVQQLLVAIPPLADLICT